jgi:hypothetical protein
MDKTKPALQASIVTLFPFLVRQKVSFFDELIVLDTYVLGGLRHELEDIPVGILESVDCREGFFFASIKIKTNETEREFYPFWRKDALTIESYLRSLLVSKRSSATIMETT